MNKYQEALNTIKTYYDDFKGASIHFMFEQEINLLQKLIDKEKPMKPIIYNINQFKCPKCEKQIKGQKMLYNLKTNRFDEKCTTKTEKVYCPYCGQKLDWSEENE